MQSNLRIYINVALITQNITKFEHEDTSAEKFVRNYVTKNTYITS